MKMKRLMIEAILVIACLIGGNVLGMRHAHSGDINFPAYKATPSIAPYYNWTGLYIGANGGYGISNNPYEIAAANNNAAILNATGAAGGSFKTDARGGFGGGQIGYNMQFAAWVLGVETDFQFGSITGSDGRTLTLAPLNIPVSLSSRVSAEMDYFGTVRARFGFAGFDRTLIYATGGLAYGHIKSNGSITLTGPVPLNGAMATSTDELKVGYVVGGGVEHAILQNWSVKAEALYVNLGDTNSTMIATVMQTPFVENTHQKNEYGIVRAGANYKF